MHMALQVDDRDNVATVFSEDVNAHSIVCVHNKRGEICEYVALEPTPYAHKMAIKDIHVGEHVMKYGESLGVATKEIKRGEHVHVHNLDSERGRGDK